MNEQVKWTNLSVEAIKSKTKRSGDYGESKQCQKAFEKT
jgi:hypothetical protein